MQEIDINQLESYCERLVSIYNVFNKTHWVCRVQRSSDGSYIFVSLKGGSSQAATKLAFSGMKNIKIMALPELQTLDRMISIYIQSLPVIN